jgi:DNA-3-methyladenine glycosylase II
MHHAIPTRQPFSFAHTLAFMRRFLPSQSSVAIDEDAVTAAITVGGRACAFTLRVRGRGLVADAPTPEVARRAGELVSASDDVRPFYAAAEGDRPMHELVRSLWGLHHVRFLGLEEVAVYGVLMQRTPMKLAVRYKQRFLERFGHRVTHGGRVLLAMPSLDQLAALAPDEIVAAIGHRPKGERIAEVVRGVAAIGEDHLRRAPYAEARRALLEIRGIGPFSAGAILLRGLGRMDELPSLDMFEHDGRAIYGRTWSPRAITQRYGDQIGYWSFYLKIGAARSSERGTPSGSARS